jgi:hypothetical protein
MLRACSDDAIKVRAPMGIVENKYQGSQWQEVDVVCRPGGRRINEE